MTRSLILLGTLCLMTGSSFADQLQVGRRMTDVEFDLTSDQKSFSVKDKTVVFVFASW